MTTTAVAIRPNPVRVARIEADTKRQEQLIDILRSLGSGSKDIVLKAMESPAFVMVASALLIEYLQRYPRVGTGRWGWQTQLDQDNPSHAQVWREFKEPLISQAMASTMEGVIFTTEGLKSLIGSGGILEIILGLLARK